jgi:ADP-ribose pyrophosphatase
VFEDEKHTSFEEAALMELEEETGYTSQNIISLGSINPNPAINNNKVHFFLAKNAHINSSRQFFPDKYEQIEVEKVSIEKLRSMANDGSFDHALSNLLIYKALDKLSKL